MKTTAENQTPPLPPKMRELFGYNAIMADEELSFATARCIYAIDRRDRLQERVRFGCLGLNSAALFALLTGGIGQDGKLVAVGVTSNTVALAAAFYIAGIVLAALAIWASTNHFISLTGPELGNLYAARQKKALFDSYESEDTHRRIKEALGKPVEHIGDFHYSPLEMFLTNGSGSVWLAGTCVILSAVVMRVTNGFCA